MDIDTDSWQRLFAKKYEFTIYTKLWQLAFFILLLSKVLVRHRWACQGVFEATASVVGSLRWANSYGCGWSSMKVWSLLLGAQWPRSIEYLEGQDLKIWRKNMFSFTQIQQIFLELWDRYIRHDARLTSWYILYIAEDEEARRTCKKMIPARRRLEINWDKSSTFWMDVETIALADPFHGG